MKILLILWFDVDDLSAVPPTMMWLILLLILADEDPSLILFRRCGDPAASSQPMQVFSWNPRRPRSCSLH